MHLMPALRNAQVLPEEIDALRRVPLLFLSSQARRLHGQCRYVAELGRDRGPATPAGRCGDGDGGVTENRSLARPWSCFGVWVSAPLVQYEHWQERAAAVLYHEYLHALGWYRHGRRFSQLEGAWPGVVQCADSWVAARLGLRQPADALDKMAFAWWTRLRHARSSRGHAAALAHLEEAEARRAKATALFQAGRRATVAQYAGNRAALERAFADEFDRRLDATLGHFPAFGKMRPEPVRVEMSAAEAAAYYQHAQ